MSRRQRRERPPRNVGQNDEPWWKWSGVVPGRVLLGSPLSRRQRSEVLRAALTMMVLFAIVVGGIVGVVWLATR